MPKKFHARQIPEASDGDEIACYICNCILIRLSACRTDGMSSSNTVRADSAPIYSTLYHSDHVSAEKFSGTYAPKNTTPEITEDMYLQNTPNR